MNTTGDQEGSGNDEEGYQKQVSGIKMEEEDQRTNSNCEAVAAMVYLCEFWHHGLSHVKAIIELLLVTLSCHEILTGEAFFLLHFSPNTMPWSAPSMPKVSFVS